MDFKYLEHTADAEFIAYGRTLDEAFVNAARAMCGLVVDPAKVHASESRDISLTASTIENLLYDWLSELLYLSEVDYLVFSRFEVKITEDAEYRLQGKACGEKVGQATRYRCTSRRSRTMTCVWKKGIISMRPKYYWGSEAVDHGES